MSFRATESAVQTSFASSKAAYTRNAEKAPETAAYERRVLIDSRLRDSNIPPEFADAHMAATPEAFRAEIRRLYAGEANDLLLCGQVGRGKTFAACAALNALAEKGRVRFASSQQIVEWSQRRFDQAASEQLSRCRGVAFLAIDDMGNEDPKGIQAVKAVLDARRGKRPTIVTTQFLAPKRGELFARRYGTETAKALESRFCLMTSMRFTGEDRRAL